jgi:nitroreductase
MLNLLNSRRSVRRWTHEPVSESDLHDILEAAMNAPSAGNEQAWQFVVLEGEVLSHYLAINRNCPKGAPVGILVCGDLKTEKYPGYHIQDCCAAMENLLLAAHARGLGAVWTAVFPDNVGPTRTLLELPPHVVPIGFAPIGTPVSPTQATSRFDATKIHRNRWVA